MDQEKMTGTKYRTFAKGQGMKLKDLLPLVRNSGYSNYDELGTITLCLEAEEWTWVKFNLSSGLLDLLGDLTVTSIDAEEDDIRAWIKTDEFNYFHCEAREAKAGA